MGMLDGKVAVITGAGSPRGQGAAEARAFALEGAAGIIVADLPGTDGQQVAREVGSVARFYPLDVTDEGQWASLVEAARAQYGQIDVLVNNAGIWLSKTIFDTTPDDYRRVVEVNQTGVFLGMRAVTPLMREAGSGSIINISSNAGLRGAGMPHAYAASKWAVRGMSRAAAWELAPYGIRVNAVCPGVIDTPMIEGGQETLEKLARMAPSGQVGLPRDVAGLVTYLASDVSGYVSGAEIAIDGAFTA